MAYLSTYRSLGAWSAAVAFLFAASVACAAPSFYAISTAGQLITIDPVTGAGSLVADNLDYGPAPMGLAYYGGSLYTYNQENDWLLRLDPGTGAILDSIYLGLGLFGEGALAINANGVGYVTETFTSTYSKLYRFTLAPNSGEIVDGQLVPVIDGLDFAPDGTLYGMSHAAQGTIHLRVIDQETGATTHIGSLGTDFSGATGGLAFGPGGNLFAVYDDDFYTVNRTNGQATLIGDTGSYTLSGLVYVPEPASLAALTLSTGIALLGRPLRRL